MDPELFEEWMMTGLVTVLILFMAFIVWDLAKKSKAGKFGTLILFFALGLGVLGFIIKGLVIGSLEGAGMQPRRHARHPTTRNHPPAPANGAGSPCHCLEQGSRHERRRPRHAELWTLLCQHRILR